MSAGAATTEAGGYLAEHGAGRELVTAIDDQLGLVEDWLRRVRALARPLPLGTNPVGVAMSAKFARVATSGPGSFSAALEAYRAVLAEARDAVVTSFDTYRVRDEQHAGEFRRVEGVRGDG